MSVIVPSTMFPNMVFAQACTSTSAEDLISCQHAAIEECRVANSCEDDRHQALSAQDVLESAASLCCSRPTMGRNRCISSFSRSLAQARQQAPRALKPFLATARSRVVTLRTNGCSTGSLGED
jgi:hypothetical protein